MILLSPVVTLGFRVLFHAEEQVANRIGARHFCQWFNRFSISWRVLFYFQTFPYILYYYYYYYYYYVFRLI